MKEHILRELINDLRDVAIKDHASQQLRERIAHRVLLAFHDDAEWYKQYEALAHIKPQVGLEIPDMKVKKPENYDYMTKLNR